jgi:succinate dehydrogenase/fumarate reductase cytochrome b subunit
MARRLAVAITAALLAALLVPEVADAAATSLNQVVDNLRVWLIGLLVGLASLFLTIAGIRYLLSGGNLEQIERAKSALKAALWGYGLAALAPVLVTVLQHVVG